MTKRVSETQLGSVLLRLFLSLWWRLPKFQAPYNPPPVQRLSEHWVLPPVIALSRKMEFLNLPTCAITYVAGSFHEGQNSGQNG